MPEEIQPLVDTDRLRIYVEREARFWGSLVRSRREALDLTLNEVAALAGTTPQTIHKVETGKIAPRDHVRLAIAFALSAEVDTLFPMPSRATVLKEIAA